MVRKTIQHLGVLLTLTAAALTCASAEAQFGGQGGGFGGVSSSTIMIEPSQSGKTLYGYSDERGKWDKLAAEPHPVDGLTPIMASSMAVVRGKNRLYVFKAEMGEWNSSPDIAGEISPPVISEGVAAAVAGNEIWAVGRGQSTWVSVDVGEPAQADQLVVHASRVVYRTSTHVHVLSAARNNWASVDLTKD